MTTAMEADDGIRHAQECLAALRFDDGHGLFVWLRDHEPLFTAALLVWSNPRGGAIEHYLDGQIKRAPCAAHEAEDLVHRVEGWRVLEQGDVEVVALDGTSLLVAVLRPGAELKAVNWENADLADKPHIVTAAHALRGLVLGGWR